MQFRSSCLCQLHLVVNVWRETLVIRTINIRLSYPAERSAEVRRIHPWGFKHHREIVCMSETGAPGIHKGPLTSAVHNHITQGGTFCVWEHLLGRSGMGLRWEEGSISPWSLWPLYLWEKLFLKLNLMIERKRVQDFLLARKRQSGDCFVSVRVWIQTLRLAF